MIVFIIGLALATSPDAVAVVTDLDPPGSIAGVWRCVDDDDPAFADPAFDDSAWKQLALPEESGARVCGDTVTWLRRRVELSGTHHKDVVVGVAVGRVDGAYEVFADGRLIGGRGTITPLVEPVHAGEAFAIPASVVDDGAVVVAVRIGNDPVLFDIDPGRRLVPSGPLVVGQMPAVDAHARMTVRDDVREQVGGFLSMGFLFAFVCLYHVIVWLLRRDRMGYLWFSVFATLVVLWLATTILRNTETLPMSSTTAGKIGNVFGTLSNVAFIEFFWQFAQKKRPTKPWRIYQILLVVIAFIGFIPDVGLAIAASPPSIIAKIILPVLALAVLIRWAWRGARDAQVLLAAVVVGVVMAPMEVLVEHAGARLPMQLSPGLVAFAFFSLVMAVALSAQFARSLEEVDTKNKELREVNASISRFVPFGFLDALERQSVREVERGDSRKREMAVMFCDVRGFTTMAESLGPDQTFRFINDYLSRMEPEIYKGAGFINQYLGDGIMALFPTTKLGGVAGADGAVSSALGMVKALAKLNLERSRRGVAPVQIGAGIHMGPLMIGTIGGGEQLDGGVIGDVVNAAARLEGMTKMYGARVLVSGEVVAGLAHTRPVLRHLDVVRAKGKTEATSIYEILDADEHGEDKKATLADFTEAQRLYKSGAFVDAAAVFDRCIAACPHDGAARLLRERCHELGAQPVEVGWAGVYTLTTKS